MSAIPSKGADRLGCLIRPDLVRGEALQDFLPRVTARGAVQVRSRRRRLALRLVDGVARAEPEGSDERLDPRPHRGVRDPELALHVAEVPARAKEALEERRLLLAESPEPADAEIALEGGPAVAAVQARHRELVRTDGTGGDDVVRHVRFVPCVRVGAGKL